MNTNKKKKRIASIAVTLILTALFSVGVFAWFSISNQANVNDLAISAGALGSLKISDTDDGLVAKGYGAEIDLNMTGDLVLNQVTSPDGKTFKAPVYSGNEVVALETVEQANLNAYVYEKQYFLKVEESGGSGEYQIYLTAKGNNKTGTYLANAVDDAVNDAVNAIRISFTATDKSGEQVWIYEPGVGGTNDENVTAADSSGGSIPDAGLKQNKASGEFDGVNTPNSPYMFLVDANDELLVTMRVWIEGKDPQCANSIQLNEVAGRIQFAADKVMANN